jgi:hypothetical protein
MITENGIFEPLSEWNFWNRSLPETFERETYLRFPVSSNLSSPILYPVKFTIVIAKRISLGPTPDPCSCFELSPMSFFSVSPFFPFPLLTAY